MNSCHLASHFRSGVGATQARPPVSETLREWSRRPLETGLGGSPRLIFMTCSIEILSSHLSLHPGLRGDPEAVRQERGRHDPGQRPLQAAHKLGREADQGGGQDTDE